jgi:hypothetical protein
MVSGQAVLQKSVLAAEFNHAVKKWRGDNGEMARIIPALSTNLFPHERPDVETVTPRLPPAQAISDERRRLAAQARARVVRRESRARRMVRFLARESAAR